MRNTVLTALLTYLSNTSASRVIRGLVTIDSVNDWPTIMVFLAREGRIHIGGGIKYGELYINLRGYVREENSNDAAEDLAEEIEQQIILFDKEQCDIGVQEARITSIRTDEGLFEPYGILDMTLYIKYNVS